MSCGRSACPRLAGTRNQTGGTTSIRFEVVRGELVHVHPVRVIKQVGLRLSDMKSREKRACPCLSGTRSKVGRTSYQTDEVVRMEGMSSSIRYKESSKRDFVCPVRRHAKGGLVPVRTYDQSSMLDIVCLVRSCTKGGFVYIHPV